jgi:hypothetical protein
MTKAVYDRNDKKNENENEKEKKIWQDNLNLSCL